jgi:hypothetical protein
VLDSLILLVVSTVHHLSLSVLKLDHTCPAMEHNKSRMSGRAINGDDLIVFFEKHDATPKPFVMKEQEPPMLLSIHCPPLHTYFHQPASVLSCPIDPLPSHCLKALVDLTVLIGACCFRSINCGAGFRIYVNHF